MDGNPYRIVASALAQERPVDEQTHASIAVLAERLEHLKAGNALFASVELSPHVKELSQRAQVLPVG